MRPVHAVRSRLVRVVVVLATVGASLAVPLARPAGAAAGEPTQITAGYAHTCSIQTGGTLYCWGDNAYGQLGDGTTTDRATPVAVNLAGVTQVSAGFNRTCAVVSGSARCWGAGQTTITTVATGVVEVAVGGEHYCWRTTANAVACAGSNSHGQAVSLTGVISLAAGLRHTCVVLTSGGAACYGDNAKRQLGTSSSSSTGGAVSGITNAVQITAGSRHSCARLTTGEVRCWGDNTNGQIGDGTVVSRPTPAAVPALTFSSVAAGEAHTCGVTTDNLAHCWGDNSLGQLGDGSAGGVKTSPTPVIGLTQVTRAATGALHSCAISTPHKAHCWGANTDGQIGDGGPAPVRTSPQRALLFSPPQQIAPPVSHTFATQDPQLFVVRAPNADSSYKARITVRQGAAVVQQFETGAAAAGNDAQGMPSPRLAPGAYSWSAEWLEIDEASEWSPSSAQRAFTVAPNQRPSAPTLVAPEAGRTWAPSEPQTFTVRATDPDNDHYTAYIEIRRGPTPQTAMYETSMTTMPSPSGVEATITAPYTLQPDTYFWFGRACDALGCGPDAALQAFTVSAAPVNQAPERPTQDAPAQDAVFMSKDAQTFTVTARDPEGDPYHGRVTVTPLGGGTPRIFDLPPARSQTPSSGEAVQRFLAGTYTWTARACQVGEQDKCGPSTTETRRFTVLPNQAPGVPTHQTPSPGHVFATRDAQIFAVTATDPDADAYQGVVTVHHPDKPNVTFRLSTAASGDTSVGAPSARLEPGSYTWSAQGCDMQNNCGASSSPQPFEVLGNLPPAVPSMDSPSAGHAFAADDSQTFKVTSTDPDLDSYVPEVEIGSEGGTSRRLEGSSTLSGQTATLTAAPPVEAGVHTWRARACQAGEPEKCSDWTDPRTFTVALPEELNQPPLTPMLVLPDDGHMFLQGDPQTFSVQAVDPEGDDYLARIRVRSLNADNVPVEFVADDSASSGAVSEASPTSPFPRGAWSWEAAACSTDDPERCSGWSSPREFSVGGTEGNAPPAEVRVLAPAPAGVFTAGERQDFSVKATDPEGEAYSTEISFRRATDNLPMRQRVLTSPVASGLPSTGTLGPSPLPPGTYVMSVTPVDARGARGPATQQTFAVAGDGPSPCGGAVVPVVDGWIGETYLRLAHTAADDAGYLCIRAAQGTETVAGWLRAESGGAHEGGGPSTGTTSSCPDRGEDNVPFPLYEVGTGDPNDPTNQLQLFLRRTGATLTACVKAKAAGGQLIDTSVTIEAPPGADLADLNFIPEHPSAWQAPAPLPPVSGLPSSSCLEHPEAEAIRLVNASLEGRHVWLHTLSTDDEQAVCARLEGEESAGLIMRAPDTTQNDAYSLTTGKHYEDDTSPCVVPELHMNGATVMRLSHTEATADRIGVCLYVGSEWQPVPDAPPAPFLSAWLLFSREPGAPEAVLTTDP